MATFTGASATPMLGFLTKRGVYHRYLNKSSVTIPRNPMLCKLSCSPSSSLLSLKTTNASSLSASNRSGVSLQFDPLSFRGAAFGDQVNNLPGLNLPRCHNATSLIVRASASIPYGIPRSVAADKPKWWRRTLACIPYLMPLHYVSLYAEYAARYIPLMTDLEILTDPFTGNQLPIWFSMIYFSAAYFGVVRNKKCPYFFRYHLVMAMLFENAIQIIGTVSTWFPYARYWGDPFWTVVAFAFFFAVFECIRKALQGTYPDIPFFSIAAVAHTR